MQEMNIYIDKQKENEDMEKYVNYYILMHYWMKNIEDGKSFALFFSKRGYKRVAIYGMGDLGIHLEKQLPPEFKPIYTVDQGIVKYDDKFLPLEKAETVLTKADVIIVTPIVDYNSIRERINTTGIDVVSLEEVILSI